MKTTLFREANEEIDMIPRETCSERALPLVSNVDPTLILYKLELEDEDSMNKPMRVLHQLEYDQGTA